jgi:hypothetical protein
MLLRWHQTRNSSSVSLAIDLVSSLGFVGRVAQKRSITGMVAKDKYTRDCRKRQVFDSYLFVFVGYYFSSLQKTMKGRM